MRRFLISAPPQTHEGVNFAPPLRGVFFKHQPGPLFFPVYDDADPFNLETSKLSEGEIVSMESQRGREGRDCGQCLLSLHSF